METFYPCPVCNLNFPESQLQRHANTHFDDNDHQNPHSGRESGDQLALISMQVRTSFYNVKDQSGGGLMALLQKALNFDANSDTIGVFLCGYVDHFQSLPSEDVGWGCGWRNIQMLSSYLLSQRGDDVRRILFGGCGFVPDIPFLQRWLEVAWGKGIDPDGARHFNYKIYGSKSWIGATECAALFRSFGLRARIVDFGPKDLESLVLSIPGSRVVKPNTRTKRKAFPVSGPMDRYVTGGRNRDVPVSVDTSCSTSQLAGGSNESLESNFSSDNKGHQVLLDWVWNYFSKDTSTSSAHHGRVIVTNKSPLYFQHDGHSRTIVGIEVRRQHNGSKLQYNLLILDPGHRTVALERSLKENIGWKKLLKRGVHTLRKRQYQLCYIDPGVASGDEMEKLMAINSSFIEI
ncbi:Zinc finger-containing ubiquitin peptidase 1 [Euphorbia peplus]|nr:Zinc finger-containing ubiquitin peptidase 1 [Euphorbia peplus]